MFAPPIATSRFRANRQNAMEESSVFSVTNHLPSVVVLKLLDFAFLSGNDQSVFNAPAGHTETCECLSPWISAKSDQDSDTGSNMLTAFVGPPW